MHNVPMYELTDSKKTNILIQNIKGAATTCLRKDSKIPEEKKDEILA